MRVRSSFAVMLFACVLFALSVASCSEPRAPSIPPLTTARPTTGATDASSDRPVTRTVDLVEMLHGVRVADPYRWLEDSESPEVRAWTEGQNAYTRKILDAIPWRDRLRDEIKELLQIGYVGAPAVRTTKTGVTRLFHTKREGTQNQPMLYVRDGISGKDRVLIDASALSEDGTTALDWWYPSKEGSFLAWGRSEAGSEQSTLFVRDVSTGKDLADRIDNTRHASVAWLPDGKTFFYSRYPAPGTVPAGEEKYHAQIYRHTVGQEASADKLVFEEGRSKTDIPIVAISPNGRWLAIRVHMGWDKSEVWLKDLSKTDIAVDAGWVAVAKDIDAIFEPIPRNDRLYIHTNDGAPHYRLFAVGYEKPQRADWTEILSEQTDVLDEVAILKNEIVVTYMHEAATRVERFASNGKARGEIQLPAIGTASISGAWDGEDVFVSFTSYVVPQQVHRLDLRARAADAQAPKLERWDTVGAKFEVSDVEIQRLYATSKDGTRVPMFVIAKKGMKRDSSNPTILYGYGGFNVNQTPWFSAHTLASVNRGAVWVTAILRGGGEFGEDWHKAGMRDQKQNVVDDFIACAETLVREKITTSEHLGIVGGSNGGLLVAAAVTQRPELFRVGLSLVPLTDMVRYHRFRIAKLLIPEYGDPEKAEDFKFLYAYSPYHHVVEGERYPSMFFSTADNDSRVDPMHARKMAARMQAAQSDGRRPILLRTETRAGHAAGKPVNKLAEQLADEMAFMLDAIATTRGQAGH